jgi:hypothetical protein
MKDSLTHVGAGSGVSANFQIEPIDLNKAPHLKFKVADLSTFDAEINDNVPFAHSFSDDAEPNLNVNDLSLRKPPSRTDLADEHIESHSRAEEFGADGIDPDHPIFENDPNEDPDWANKPLILKPDRRRSDPPAFSVAPTELQANEQIPVGSNIASAPPADVSLDGDVVRVQRQPMPGDQRKIAQAATKLEKFFNKSGMFRDFGGGLRSDDVVGIGHDSEILRLNELLKKARWGKDKLVRPRGMSRSQWNQQKQAGSRRVARLAAQDPKRFAELFEMRASPGGPKHGTETQRHLAYGIMYAMAKDGRSIEEIEQVKKRLTQKMHAARGGGSVWRLEGAMQNALEDINAGKSVTTSLEMKLGIGLDPEHRYWSNLNFQGIEPAMRYTAAKADKANQAKNNHPEHLAALAGLGLPEDDAGYVMQHISKRLPHLESSPTDHPADAEDSDPVNPDAKPDNVLKPGDPNYIETYNKKMADMLSVKNFRVESGGRDIPHLYAKDEDLQDERMDKARAIIYAIGTAHPEKVMNDELRPFSDELCQLSNHQLDRILHLLNRDAAPHRDELFNDMKTLVEGQFRQQQMNRGLNDPLDDLLARL